VLNKGELNDFTQDKLIFYYKDGVDYAWWQNDQFNSVQTFIDKLSLKLYILELLTLM
jgi:hypothetical protein